MRTDNVQYGNHQHGNLPVICHSVRESSVVKKLTLSHWRI